MLWEIKVGDKTRLVYQPHAKGNRGDNNDRILT